MLEHIKKQMSQYCDIFLGIGIGLVIAVLTSSTIFACVA